MAERRRCSKCGTPLNIYHNPTHICSACQDKLATETLKGFDGPNIDVKQIAYILDLTEEGGKAIVAGRQVTSRDFSHEKAAMGKGVLPGLDPVAT